MVVPKEDQNRVSKPILNFSGGMNPNVGEFQLKENEAKRISNFGLLQGGGLEFGYNGFKRKVTTLPFPCTHLFRRFDKYSKKYQFFAYAPPKLYQIHWQTNGYSEVVGGNFLNYGDAFVTHAEESTYLFDGNTPLKTSDGITWSAFSNFPPTHTRNNQDDIYTASKATNPSEYKNPTFGAAYFPSNRLVIDNPKLPFQLNFSKSRSYDDFRINLDPGAAGNGDSISLILEYRNRGNIVAFGSVANFFVIFARDGIGVLNGTNAPIVTVGDPFGNSVPDPIKVAPIVDELGLLNKHLFARRGNSDYWFMSDYGLYTLSTSETFQTMKPGLVSFPIQNLLAELGVDTLRRRAFLYNDVNNGRLYLVTPKAANKKMRQRMYILNYLIHDIQDSGDTPQLAWTIQEGFGDFFSIDAMVSADSKHLLISNRNEIWLMNDGTSYGDTEIFAEAYTRPYDFDLPQHRKKLFKYQIEYESETGFWLEIHHSWENGQGGMVQVFLPATSAAAFGLKGASGFSEDASLGSMGSSASSEIYTKTPEVTDHKEGLTCRFRYVVHGTNVKGRIHRINALVEPMGTGPVL